MSVPPDGAPVAPTSAGGNGHGPFTGPFTGPFGGPFTRPPRRHRPWYRRWAIWAVIVAVIAGATVVSDLPQPQSLRQQATVAAGVVKEIATGVHPCAYAVSQSFSIYRGYTDGTFPKADRGLVPQYLSEDQQACSFENTAIFGMSTITVPSSPAGVHLSALVDTALEWSTSDANGAIVAIRTLVDHPTNPKALKELASRERSLASDHSRARRELRAAERDLGGAQLPGVGLPTLPVSSRATS